MRSGRVPKIAFVAAGTGIALAVIAARLVYVQVVKAPVFQKLAEQRQMGTAASVGARGEIVDRNGDVLAISVPAVSIYAHPHRIGTDDRQRICGALQAEGFKNVCTRLGSDSKFVWLARSVPRDGVPQLTELAAEIDGLGLLPGTVRRYPKGDLAGQLIGFVGVDGQGLEGLERSLDDILRPQPKRALVERDARRKFLIGTDDLNILAGGRQSVELTIDGSLQALVERSLSQSLETFGGRAAIALLAEVETGAVRAAAMAPSFDPSRFKNHSPADWRPRFATDTFEPGSTVKPIVLAAALSKGMAMHEIVFGENGKFLVDEHVITDDEPHGWLSLRNVVVKSSNIGAVKVGAKVGKSDLHQVFTSFGFGQKLGVRLPSEARGILRPASRWSELDFATASFGQGLSVSPLQLLYSYLVLARDGSMQRPYFVERIFDPSTGEMVWSHSPLEESVFPHPDALSQVRHVLASVVDEGTGARARVDGLAIGGKTGTAQKPDLVAGGYREGAYIAWFAGMFPIHRPKWVGVVLVDEPSVSIYGGAVAAPVFREIAESVAIREGLLSSLAANAADQTLPDPVRIAVPTPEIDRVPDLVGLSLRDAGRLAQWHGASLVPLGSGIIVGQTPAAGQQANRGDTWHVRLERQGAG